MPKFLNDESKKNFESRFEQILNEIVRVGAELTLDPWESDKHIDTLKKLRILPQNQQKSALKKVDKITVFKTGKITERFASTLKQKLINLLYADLVGKPLREARDTTQWSGMGRCAKLNMDYKEFFVIDDILCVLGIAEQHIPDDGWKDEETLQTRIWLTDYGKSLFDDSHKGIINYLESNEDFKEVIMTKPVQKKVKDKKTGRVKLENASVPFDYKKTDHVSRKIKRVKSINRIYENQRLTIRCSDKLLTTNEVNKLLIQHLDGKIQIRNLVYSLPKCTSNEYLLNANVIDVINKMLCRSGDKGKVIRREGEANCVNRPKAGIKGCSGTLCQYNKKIDCQTDNENIIINYIEFEILDKRIHRVFSRKNWSLHGRYYAYWNTMKKIFRSGVYLNDSTLPMVSMDFSAMH